MISTQFLFASMLICSTIAVPYDDSSKLKKRQLLQSLGLPKGVQLSNLKPDVLSSLMPLLRAATSNNLGYFFGEPDATKSLMAFGKLLGANNDSAGGFPDYMLNLAKGNGLVPDPPEALGVPKRQEIQSQLKTPGVKAVKIRYGPYKVPGTMSKDHHADMPRGMLENYPHLNFEKPCTGDCTIIGMRPNLEYPNGTVANIDSGPWLHHAVLVAIGPGREDISCSQYEVSIPHMGVNSTPRASERFFAIGNERVPLVFPDLGHDDVGYRISKEDKFAAIIDLANENPTDAVVYFTMTWDILEGHPLANDVRMVWHDIRNCGSSEANPPKGQTRFTLSSSWTSTVDADTVAILSHMHDGGVKTILEQKGTIVCDSDASYGSKPGYITRSTEKHISDMNTCSGDNLKVKQIKKGQEWSIKAEYDFEKYPGLKGEKGGWDKIMGINYMYVKK